MAKKIIADMTSTMRRGSRWVLPECLLIAG